MTAVQLGDTDRRTLELLAAGHTHAAIGRQTGRSPHAATMALSRIYRQLGAVNGANAVWIACQAGLLAPAEVDR